MENFQDLEPTLAKKAYEEAAYFVLKAMQKCLLEDYKSALATEEANKQKNLEDVKQPRVVEKTITVVSENRPTVQKSSEPIQKKQEISSKGTFAIHLPYAIRDLMKKNDMQNPKVQACLECLHKAAENGEVIIEERKCVQPALDAGIHVGFEDVYNYVAINDKVLYKVSRELESICRKQYNIKVPAKQKSVAKKVAKPVTSKKSKKVFVINLPAKIKNAFKQKNFENPETQEYLNYILCAIDKGLLITVERQNKAQVKKHNITLSDDSDLFFVAKDGAAYLQITHELHEIRKKYENHEKTANLSTKITIQTPISKPHEEIKEKTSPKLSKKKSLKVKDKTVCLGGDGTIFFPFN